MPSPPPRLHISHIYKMGYFVPTPNERLHRFGSELSRKIEKKDTSHNIQSFITEPTDASDHLVQFLYLARIFIVKQNMDKIVRKVGLLKNSKWQPKSRWRTQIHFATDLALFFSNVPRLIMLDRKKLYFVRKIEVSP